MSSSDVGVDGIGMLLDADALAQELGVSIRTVRRLDAAGKLPKPVRLGAAVRWRRDEIIRWIQADCPDRRIWESSR